MVSAWTSLATRWIKNKLESGESDEELEDLMQYISNPDPDNSMVQDNLFVLTSDILYRCNYFATVEGLIGNKMVVDTVFDAPDWVPFWVKCVLFFVVTMPMMLLTLIDDVVAGFIIYDRLSVHYDFFDGGIIVGKLARGIF